jgi:general secretion pathway protein G
MNASLERLRARREELDGEGGFTLIELLIVIVILGVLAAIVVFAVQNLTHQSAQSACQSDYKTVETAAEAYKAQEGAYPAAIANLTAVAGDGNGPWLKDAPSSSKYSITIGTPVSAAGYQAGVVVVTPTGGAANPAPSGGGGGTASAASASAACSAV